MRARCVPIRNGNTWLKNIILKRAYGGVGMLCIRRRSKGHSAVVRYGHAYLSASVLQFGYALPFSDFLTHSSGEVNAICYPSYGKYLFVLVVLRQHQISNDR